MCPAWYSFNPTYFLIQDTLKEMSQIFFAEELADWCLVYVQYSRNIQFSCTCGTHEMHSFSQMLIPVASQAKAKFEEERNLFATSFDYICDLKQVKCICELMSCNKYICITVP